MMPLETIPWDAADHLTSDAAIIAYLEAAFENGDPALVAAAINDVGRARGLPDGGLAADADFATVIRKVKALGLELTAKAA